MFCAQKKEKKNGRPSESLLWVENLTKVFYGKEWHIFFQIFWNQNYFHKSIDGRSSVWQKLKKKLGKNRISLISSKFHSLMQRIYSIPFFTPSQEHSFFEFVQVSLSTQIQDNTSELWNIIPLILPEGRKKMSSSLKH